MSPLEIRACVEPLVENRGGVTIMRNGTLLFIKKADDDVQSARLALDEARFLTDFRVKRLQDGNFLVALHSAVAVFVGASEFDGRQAEIKSRCNELKFPSEELLVPHGWSEEEFLVGLYGRGKLQRDIHNFDFYARID
ncbi:hypothetical protein ACNRDG_06625 [Ralstonia pseudosolanacearum]|uniref:hypothetical protein n=1 Tax=Ralstonia pseudosolanacearum TaxID=1310165 RepID=UPI003AADAFC9